MLEVACLVVPRCCPHSMLQLLRSALVFVQGIVASVCETRGSCRLLEFLGAAQISKYSLSMHRSGPSRVLTISPCTYADESPVVDFSSINCLAFVALDRLEWYESL